MTNYPWPIDKPIEEIEARLSPEYYYGGFEKEVRYLLDRLKIAEAERDNWKREYYAAKSLLDEYYN